MIDIITCITDRDIIGVVEQKKMLWRIEDELNFFKNYVKDKTLIVGERTWSTMKNGGYKDVIVLNRENINDIDKLIKKKKNYAVCGGKYIYDLFLSKYTFGIDKVVVSVLNNGHYQKPYMMR